MIPSELKKEATAVSIDALRFGYVDEMNQVTRHVLSCPEEALPEALKELKQRFERFHIAIACLHEVAASIDAMQPSGGKTEYVGGGTVYIPITHINPKPTPSQQSHEPSLGSGTESK